MASAATTRCRVSVVGLSGRDKGREGVGKSCLCNRFVRPAQNEYREDHISQLSNSDWMSQVINNQHFLYWGAVEKRVSSDSERLVSFEIVEQSEFEDDSSFKPFGVTGANGYLKRAPQVKLSSSGKLMYMDKDQVALPTDYEVQDFPAKFVVDGFIVVADVSRQHNRAADAQANLLSKLLPLLAKQKKPVVVAASKCDDLSEKQAEDLEAIVAKAGRGVHVVRTSAREAINVDAPFFLLEQLQAQRSSRFLGRVPGYAEAARARQEEKETSRRVYQSLLDAKVTDFRVTWNRAHKTMLQAELAFEQFVALAGTTAARRVALQHVKRLKADKQAERLTAYQQQLPDVLLKVLTADARGRALLSSDSKVPWSEVKELLREMAEFERHFVLLADERHWHDDENLVSTGTRIPADVLDEEFVKNSFDSMRRKAQLQADQEEVAGYLRCLLDEWQERMLPGMDWTTANQLLVNHPRYKAVPETVALPTFEKFEQDLRETCKSAFGELLLENIELFDQLSSVAQPSNENLIDIESHLVNETAYRRLDLCPSDRDTIMWNTVASRHKPPLNGDVCHAIGRLHSEKTWMLGEYKWFMAPNDHHVNVVLLGMDQLPHELNEEIEGVKTEGRIRLSENNDDQYQLTVRTVNSASVSANAFFDDDFAPQGLIGVFSSPESVEYLQRVLGGIMLHTPMQSALDPVPFRGLPCVLVNAVDHQKAEVDHLEVEKNGQRLAYRLQCPVVSGRTKVEGKRVTPLQAIESVSSLIKGIQHRHSALYGGITSQPDLKIAVCCIAQDQIYAERLLGPLLRHQCCWRPCQSSSSYTDTLYLEMCFGRSMRIVQVKVFSSMRVDQVTRDVKHGFLVVHSTARKASLIIARLLLSKLPATVPSALVSVPTCDCPEENSAEQALLAESTEAAAALKSMPLVAGPSFQFDEVAFTDFLNEAWDRRDASVQTQTADSHRPRCNTPASMASRDSSSSLSASFNSLQSAPAPPLPLLHKRAVFDDMDIRPAASLSSLRPHGRPKSMSFEGAGHCDARGSLDYSADGGLDSEYALVPGSILSASATIGPSVTPGRTSPRPLHARKASLPVNSLGGSAEAVGVVATTRASVKSLVGRGLGTLGRSRKSKSPSVTSESGNELEAVEVDMASPATNDTFYAEPLDVQRHVQSSIRKQKLSHTSSLTLPQRGGSSSRIGSQISSTSSTGSVVLDEYATPADVRISLASQSRTATPSVRSSTSSVRKASVPTSASSERNDYADPWESFSEASRPPSSQSADDNYAIPADLKRLDKVPPSPLLASRGNGSTSQAEEYALPADILPPSAKKISPAAASRKPRLLAGPKSATLGHGTAPPQSRCAVTGATADDEYAFPHDVLKPMAVVKQMANSVRWTSEPALGASLPNLAQPNTPAPPPPASPSPLKSWISKSMKRTPKPLSISPEPKPGARLAESSPVDPRVSPLPKGMVSPRDAFAALSKEFNARDSVAGPSSSPVPKPRKAPKPKFDPRWSRPDSVHQIGMTDVQMKLRGADEGDISPRSPLNKLKETESGSPSSTRSVSPRVPLVVVEHRTSTGNSQALSSCGSDSVQSSDDELPIVTRATLQRNTTGIRDQSGGEEVSITEEVEMLYALTARQVGPHMPPPAPPLPDYPGPIDNEQQIKRSLETEIRQRRKNSMAKARLVGSAINTPLVNESDSEEETPPLLPPRGYTCSDSDDDESLASSRGDISKTSGEGRMTSLMRKAMFQKSKISKEEKDRKRVERELQREGKRRKTKKWKREEEERLRREAEERYVKIFQTSLAESPTRDEHSRAPMFVEICVEFIEANGMDTKGLYRISGNKLVVDKLREQYAQEPGVECCQAAPDISVVTSALKSFFHMLSEPLIPASIYQELVAIVETAAPSAEPAVSVRDILLSALSPKAKSVLAYMVQHLHRVSGRFEENLMSARNLSIVWGPNFTSLPMDASSATLSTSLNQVVDVLITHCDVIFGTGPSSPPPPPPPQAASPAAPTPAPLVEAYSMITLNTEKVSRTNGNSTTTSATASATMAGQAALATQQQQQQGSARDEEQETSRLSAFREIDEALEYAASPLWDKVK